MLSLPYTAAVTCALLLIGWLAVKRAALGWLERSILVCAAFTVSMSLGIATSFWLVGNLAPVVIFPTAALSVILLACDLRGHARAAEPWTGGKINQKIFVLALMLGVIGLGVGRQFQYQSAWGDVGAYLTAGQFYSTGGSVTFKYESRGRLLAEASRPLPLTGVVNDTPGGAQQFHALAGWPGWMTLFGTNQNRAAVLPLLFAFCIGTFYILATRLFGRTLAPILSTVAFALLPVAWFQSLYATSEMLALSTTLASLTLFFYSRSGTFALAAGMFAFGTIHISLIVFIPLISAALAIVGIYGAKTEWWTAKAGALACISGLCAVLFALHTSNSYATAIFSSLFGDRPWMVWLIAVLPIVSVVLTIAFLRLPKLKAVSKWAWTMLLQHSWQIGTAVITLMLLGILFQAFLLGWTKHYLPKNVSIYDSTSARVAYVDKGFRSILHLSALNLLGASGLIGLAAFFTLPLAWRQRPDLKTISLWLACVYIVGIYGVAAVDVTNNYYASRYFVPVATPLLLLLSVPWLGVFGKKALLALLGAPVAAYYIWAMLFQGFFTGNQRFAHSIHQLFGDSPIVYVDGSSWLQYFIAPSLMSNSLSPKSDARSIQSSARLNPTVIVTDVARLSANDDACITKDLRQIPWQIGYLTKPAIEKKTVCVVRRASGPERLTLGANQWLVRGSMTFPIQRPAGSGSVRVTVLSYGWWATKSPFADPESLRPRLEVCGHPFKLAELSPKQIVFVGTLSQPVCNARLQTATFVPRAIGEGTDSRELGMDLYEIVTSPTLD